MNKKILGILVMMLLIAPVFSATGLYQVNENKDIQPIPKNGIDQEQTEHCNRGFNIVPSQWCAQSFIPSVETLTAVQLYIFKHDNPPAGLEFTVSIRESINGSDLTSAVADADQIEDWKWVTFDFPDITVIPGNTYYIICRCNGGEGTDMYCWFYENDSPYEKGSAWLSHDEGNIWKELTREPTYTYPDFCFKTWNTESKNRMKEHPILDFLENHPHLFPILRQLLLRTGLHQ
ncbi:MAG: hypothetical protein DRN27_09505 [Thermoplasmata archaeon]|nr:MAG: hypothetical protein DRN27_09505 [Thermoplasmata archaeon]